MVEKVTSEEIKELARSIVKLSTGWDTIISPTQGVTPDNQYCTVRLADDEPYQYEISDYSLDIPTGQLERNQVSETRVTVEIQAFGKGAFDKLKGVIADLKNDARFYGALNDPDLELRFLNAPLWQFLGFSGHDSVQDISIPFMGKTQPRAVTTVYFYALWQKANPVQAVDSFDKVDITINNLDNNTSHTVTITE